MHFRNGLYEFQLCQRTLVALHYGTKGDIFCSAAVPTQAPYTRNPKSTPVLKNPGRVHPFSKRRGVFGGLSSTAASVGFDCTHGRYPSFCKGLKGHLILKLRKRMDMLCKGTTVPISQLLLLTRLQAPPTQIHGIMEPCGCYSVTNT